MRLNSWLAAALAVLLNFAAPCAAASERKFDKVFIIVLENASASQALRQPYLRSLVARGAYLEDFRARTHPSQPNYIALTSGSTHGVKVNTTVDLDVRHVGDLLEEKGLIRRQYASGYPGGCFLGMESGRYRRRHAPFLSYRNVQQSPVRCRYTVNASQLDGDIAAGRLPTYAMYIPDMDENGHDPGVAAADRWLRKVVRRKIQRPAFHERHAGGDHLRRGRQPPRQPHLHAAARRRGKARLARGESPGFLQPAAHHRGQLLAGHARPAGRGGETDHRHLALSRRVAPHQSVGL